MATKKAMVILFDPVTCTYQKYRNAELVHKVRYLEKYVARECAYYDNVSIADYKRILCLDIPVQPMDYAMAVEGRWFTVEQKGWFKGLPLMTIDIQNNEWDPD